MNLTENFESVKKFAVDAAQTATQKAKILAAVAKANVSIYAEEDKIRKAEAQLGKLYYRDYAVGEEMDTAEYLPWCQKIDESKKLIAELKDYIDDVKAANETPSEAPAASAEDFADAQPEQEQTASEEAPCACTETPCCSSRLRPKRPLRPRKSRSRLSTARTRLSKPIETMPPGFSGRHFLKRKLEATVGFVGLRRKKETVWYLFCL